MIVLPSMQIRAVVIVLAALNMEAGLPFDFTWISHDEASTFAPLLTRKDCDAVPSSTSTHTLEPAAAVWIFATEVTPTGKLAKPSTPRNPVVRSPFARPSMVTLSSHFPLTFTFATEALPLATKDSANASATRSGALWAALRTAASSAACMCDRRL